MKSASQWGVGEALQIPDIPDSVVTRRGGRTACVSGPGHRRPLERNVQNQARILRREPRSRAIRSAR